VPDAAVADAAVQVLQVEGAEQLSKLPRLDNRKKKLKRPRRIPGPFEFLLDGCTAMQLTRAVPLLELIQVHLAA
jgi:hypothetical protein